MIIYPGTSRVQPHAASVIARPNNALARGLVYAQIGGWLDTSPGVENIPTAITRAMTIKGPANQYVRGSSSRMATSVRGTWTRMSVIVGGTYTNLSASNEDIHASVRTAGNAGWTYGSAGAAGSPPNRTHGYRFTLQGVATYVSTTGIAGDDNVATTSGISFISNSNVRFYNKGLFFEQVSTGALSSPGTETLLIGAQGPASGPGTYSSFDLNFIYVWDGVALSDDQHLEIALDPYSLWRRRRPLYFSTGGSTSGAGTASFTFTATGTGSSIANSTGSASFTFTPTGVGASTAPSAGSATVTFNATGVGTASANGDGTASFVFTATGVGASSTSGQGVGTADVVFSASAVGQSTAASVGSASFVFNATAVGANASGAGAASFTFTATGVGTSGATSSGVGTASFTFDAFGYSQDFVYPAKVALRDKHLTNLALEDTNVSSVSLTDSALTKVTITDIGNV